MLRLTYSLRALDRLQPGLAERTQRAASHACIPITKSEQGCQAACPTASTTKH